MTRERAIPISGSTGIQDIERLVNESAFDKSASKKGTISQKDVSGEYAAHIRKFATARKGMKVAVDFANAMGILEAKSFDGVFEVDPLFDKLDGSFPNHEANPLMAETLHALQDKLRTGRYDFGVAFDGDADRAGFLDEKGSIIAMDVVTALIAQDLLSRDKGVIFYDLRSSWAVKEIILENGGKPMMSRVGHAFIKQQMNENDAIFAGELSGHYYFRDNFYTESSSLAAICIANIISKTGEKLSDLVKPVLRYFASGEINSRVKDPAAALAKLKAKYADGKQISLDGVSVEYPDWWFNVRCSNTEPVVRLNLEAKTREKMEKQRDELVAIIRG
jgi:phosphomannomutase